MINTVGAASPIRITGLYCSHCGRMDSLEREPGENLITGAPAICRLCHGWTQSLDSVSGRIGGRLQHGNRAKDLSHLAHCCEPVRSLVLVDLETYDYVDLTGPWRFDNRAFSGEQHRELILAYREKRPVVISLLLPDGIAYVQKGIVSNIARMIVFELEGKFEISSRHRAKHFHSDLVLQELRRLLDPSQYALSESSSIRGFVERNGWRCHYRFDFTEDATERVSISKLQVSESVDYHSTPLEFTRGDLAWRTDSALAAFILSSV